MKTQKTLLKLLFLSLLAFLLIHCGASGLNGQNASTACSPNVIDNGLQVQVMPLTANSNTYSFTLCAAGQPSTAVYSVYGGLGKSDVSPGSMNLLAAQRLSQITGSTQPGATFQVTFTSTDTYFAIYEDANDGYRYIPSNSNTMVSPHRIPGR